jgi:phosphopantothenoylcysteine synthetase/decarboxylase
MAPQAPTSLAGREVLLCLTGGIACTKSADLASRLVQSGATVTVAMTDAATQLIGPATFRGLTRQPVYTSLWQPAADHSIQHISLVDRAEIMVIAPATANIIGKIAAGIADDLVSTLAMAATDHCPLVLAPAMNTSMWHSPAVQRNIATLAEWGVELLGPAEGNLACGTTGPGRMVEPAEIFDHIAARLATL